jgi:FtsP/CotA-like multicopper oxidase with cupredoxin domain
MRRAGLALALAACATERRAPLPVVAANDNRTPAGTLKGDTLTLALDVRMARWFPESDSGPHVDLPVFTEIGKAPQIPGPLIRVRRGTIINVTVRNTLPDSALRIHGLYTRPAAKDDSLTIPPGASHTFRFAAGEPGTYFYQASPGAISYRVRERDELSGALIVDADGAPNDDRIFVMNIWGEPPTPKDYRNALAINGRSWPHSERIDATIGDSVRWRWINTTSREHPMHLHGFYFRVDRRGNVRTDSSYAPDQRRLAVTETMAPGGTMSVVWSPNRDGNWLFHCHIAFHVVPDAARLDPPAGDSLNTLMEDPDRHMAGLVLGIRVSAPASWRASDRAKARQLRLHIQEGKPHRRGRSARALGFVLQRDAKVPATDSIEPIGSMLVMHRDEPVDITVLNHLPEPSAIHWHGIELESYSDGVAGWSGGTTHRAPMIAPRDSFTARLTLPRAGTFIYHTHLGDVNQLTSGLYGGIVVLEPGQRFDPSTDHVFVGGWDSADDPPHLLVNGDSLGASADFAYGVPHRLRFINIGSAGSINARLSRDSSVVEWLPLAKDGAALPSAQAVIGPATTHFNVGETADFEFRPPSRGEYLLKMWIVPKDRPYQVRIHVR